MTMQEGVVRVIPLDRPGYRIAAWVGIAALGAGAVVEAVEADWRGVLLFTIFGAGALVVVGLIRRLPSLFGLLSVIAALLSACGWAWDVARRFPLYDQFNHVFTIFAITLALGYLTYHSVGAHFQQHRSHFVLAIASFGVSIGALWEIFEWLIGAIGPPTDIVFDLAADSVGALGAGIVSAWALRRDQPVGGHEETAWSREAGRRPNNVSGAPTLTRPPGP